MSSVLKLIVQNRTNPVFNLPRTIFDKNNYFSGGIKSMFILTPIDLFDILKTSNDKSFVSIDKNNTTIIANVDPLLLEYPKGYFFNTATGNIEGPDNTIIRVEIRKPVKD